MGSLLSTSIEYDSDSEFTCIDCTRLINLYCDEGRCIVHCHHSFKCILCGNVEHGLLRGTHCYCEEVKRRIPLRCFKCMYDNCDDVARARMRRAAYGFARKDGGLDTAEMRQVLHFYNFDTTNKDRLELQLLMSSVVSHEVFNVDPPLGFFTRTSGKNDTSIGLHVLESSCCE